MEENLEVRPWVLEKVGLPQHTDHAGVMWHGSYFEWLEEARISALLKVGLAYSHLSNEGFEMPVVEMSIKYIVPLFHGDLVLLHSWVSRGKGPRWHWKTTFLKSSKRQAAVANVDLVLIHKKKSLDRILRKGPAHISKELFDLQQGEII